MLNLIVKPHRASLRAQDATPQKLFVMLKLIPEQIAAASRSSVVQNLTVDTSASMRDTSGHGEVKLEQAIEASHVMIDDERLTAEDQFAIVHFDDNALALLPRQTLGNRRAAHAATESLRDHSGGTRMARGMKRSLEQFGDLPRQYAKRCYLLTDGQTSDEEECYTSARHFAESNIPIIALGVGDTYNEALLRDIAAVTGGRAYHLTDMTALRQILNDEVGSSVREVITDIKAHIGTVGGTSVNSVMRVYPSLSEVTPGDTSYALGNIAAGDFTIFVVELTLADRPRPASRARLAQISLTGFAPGLGRQVELPPADLFITFTTDEAAINMVDDEVMGYVQQKNIDRMLQDVIRLAPTDKKGAIRTIQVARNMTVKLNNGRMTKILDDAEIELNNIGSISANTRKTLTLGGRTRTVKTANANPDGLSTDETIRRLTGV